MGRQKNPNPQATAQTTGELKVKKTTQVTLEITYDTQRHCDPHQWDWEYLLSIDEDDPLHIVSVSKKPEVYDEFGVNTLNTFNTETHDGR